jgi:hypothetical protein
MGWNRNIKRILLFAILFIGANELIKLYFEEVSVSDHMLVKQEKRFESYKEDLKYLVLGNSRASRAIDTSLLTSSYAYCSGGESNVQTYYKLKYLLETQGDRITNVVLPIGLNSIGLYRPDKNLNSFYWSKYMDYVELMNSTNNFSTYSSVAIKAKMFPYFEYPYMKMLKEYGEARIIGADSIYQFGSEEEREELAADLLAHQHRFVQINHAVAVEYISKTIRLVEHHNKQLIYVKYPITNYYVEASSGYEMDIKQEEIDDIAKTDSSNVLWLDCQNLYSDQPEYFKDVHHLNEKGKKNFTNYLEAYFSKMGID